MPERRSGSSGRPTAPSATIESAPRRAAARTAAGSALATRLLARADSRVLAILGTGVQARSHAAALTRARDFDEIRVAGRDREKAEALADEIGGTAAGSWEEALRGADVV